VPVGYLVLSGAGLNQYVCLTSLFGVLLFLVVPFKAPKAISIWALAILCGMSVWTTVDVMVSGYESQLQMILGCNRGQTELFVNVMTRDAQERKLKNVRFVVCSEARQFSTAWMHLLVYQRGGRFVSGNAEYQGVLYIPVIPWFDERIQHALEANDETVLREYLNSIDYLCIPEPETVALFEAQNPNYPILPYMRKLIAAAERLEKLTPISIRQGFDKEWFRLYRVEHKVGG